VDGYYHCPHHPDATIPSLRLSCDCRKPLPGLLVRAAADLALDLKQSFTVGDRRDDVEAGMAAGTRTVQVRTGYGLTGDSKPPGMADVVVDNLAAAAAWILTRERR
jgi:D-glycero-D-manno-heptose 1,7-bisphosphate phosphatase